MLSLAKTVLIANKLRNKAQPENSVEYNRMSSMSLHFRARVYFTENLKYGLRAVGAQDKSVLDLGGKKIFGLR